MRVTLITGALCSLMAFQQLHAQDMQKPKWWWGKQKKEAFLAKKDAQVLAAEEQEEATNSMFVFMNGNQACLEDSLISKIPEPKGRINLNKTDQCADSVEISDGVFIDMDYLTAHDYYSTWDTHSVNPYDYSIKSFQDTVGLNLFDEAKAKEAWSYPLDECVRVTSNYGFRRWRFHHGVDLKLNIGDPVKAVFDGVVRIAKYNRRGYGYYVLIRHKNGLETLYGHMKEYHVKPGDMVKAGEVIGLGGNTGRSSGPHLHFEVRYQGHGFNPRDMFDFVDQKEPLIAQFDLTPNNYRLLLSAKSSVYHKIRSGDSLWSISKRYHTSISKICKLNGISRNTTLRLGRRIRVR
ncbi:M23 family metallopeptidase [Limibacter armeniacum]|uniref:M23 family metallopeptidase n=1 Tax=Limibacter armeniacum TaxID=466084 RepID=UPI002FE601C9